MVKEIISKDSLYDPLKNLRDAYPKWLEDNWQSLSDEDLERYNKQLDKITEICKMFEDYEKEHPGEGEMSEEKKNEIFSHLSELQAFGHPPESLRSALQKD